MSFCSAKLGIDSDFSEVNLLEVANFSPGPGVSQAHAESLALVAYPSYGSLMPVLPESQWDLSYTYPRGRSYKSTANVIDYLVWIPSTKVAPETSITKVVHGNRIKPILRRLAL